MNLHANRPRYKRRKSDTPALEQTVDALAMSICPVAEWQDYERRLQQVAWKTGHNGQPCQGKLRVFPTWKKYRPQALRVATLQQAAPVLRYLPLKVSCILGDILFK